MVDLLISHKIINLHHLEHKRLSAQNTLVILHVEVPSSLQSSLLGLSTNSPFAAINLQFLKQKSYSHYIGIRGKMNIFLKFYGTRTAETDDVDNFNIIA